MAVIYHIASIAAWENLGDGAYRGDTLESDGFIHCSTREQALRTAERYYKGRTGLALLEIEEARLAAPLRYEVSTGGDLFPHIYGPLNRDAVVAVYPFEPEMDGTFKWPG
ncbi:MAG TPA: DUF952 domain-containing protein [Anaerolineaceae bacterium]